MSNTTGIGVDGPALSAAGQQTIWVADSLRDNATTASLRGPQGAGDVGINAGFESMAMSWSLQVEWATALSDAVRRIDTLGTDVRTCAADYITVDTTSAYRMGPSQW